MSQPDVRSLGAALCAAALLVGCSSDDNAGTSMPSTQTAGAAGSSMPFGGGSTGEGGANSSGKGGTSNGSSGGGSTGGVVDGGHHDDTPTDASDSAVAFSDAATRLDASSTCKCTAPATCGGGGTPGACGYSTNFSANPLQMPISEGGIWWNGQQTGKLWSDVFAGLGHAYGAPTNTTNGNGQYDDPTAVLEGSWNPNQKATGKAFCSNNVVDHINYPEVELRLRFTVAANVAKGYEIMWRCSDSTPGSLASSYLAVAAWLGGSGQYTVLTITLPNSSTAGLVNGGGVEDGDTVAAAIYGSTISIYRNGQLQGKVTDSRYTSGNPGFGFNYVSADNGSPTSGYNVDFGFSTFSATDLLAAP